MLVDSQSNLFSIFDALQLQPVFKKSMYLQF